MSAVMGIVNPGTDFPRTRLIAKLQLVSGQHDYIIIQSKDCFSLNLIVGIEPEKDNRISIFEERTNWSDLELQYNINNRTEIEYLVVCLIYI